MPLTNSMEWMMNPRFEQQVSEDGPAAFLHPERIEAVNRLVSSMEGYVPTPLVNLPALAGFWGLGAIYVKDESKRFGLNAFKVLGGIHAVANVICRRLGVGMNDMTFQQLISEETREKLGDLLFVTATDGNHGRGIAWAARQLGQRAVVFMPKGSSARRLEMIQREGAEASITEMNYDDAVRHAREYAQAHDGIVVQDTAWEGYEEIPAWIMQGYAVMMEEISGQLKELGKLPPTHVFLQAGVGSFAGAIQGYLAAKWGEHRPQTVVVEPDQADCYFRTASIDDGMPHAVTGDMATIMAGLACGEPNLLGWKILRKYTRAFVSCADPLAARGMRILAAPMAGDPVVVSGESGAVGMGVLAEMMQQNTNGERLAKALQMNAESRILIISTEGDTDPDQYRRIVWEGAYPSQE
ncbi:diaminopropionate ammonia-lyase [Anoxynatronum sibiricum]|uniref:Diaminopropionate ammonia-lyase n=1 Tax=Anoxynatronum sibiricum TaxID=210623 RepID=A0ABU9VR11_9CLOT